MRDFTLPTDYLTGCVVRPTEDGPAVLLVTDGAPCPLRGALLAGEIALRYGLAMLYEPGYLLVGWVHDDFRREYEGEAAFDFMLHRGDRFPRADVLGQRVSTGAREEMFLKQFDLARGVFAFAAAPAGQARPVLLGAAVWLDAAADAVTPLGEGDERTPALLARAVPCVAAPPAALRDLPALLEGLPQR